MAEDWKVGDLALCVDARKIGRLPLFCYRRTGLKKGAIYQVSGMAVSPDTGNLLLILRDFDASGFRHYPAAFRFKRIPSHTPDAEDAETIRLLTGAPVRVEA